MGIWTTIQNFRQKNIERRELSKRAKAKVRIKELEPKIKAAMAKYDMTPEEAYRYVKDQETDEKRAKTIKKVAGFAQQVGANARAQTKAEMAGKRSQRRGPINPIAANMFRPIALNKVRLIK